jgi:lipoyl(octanoyl) transferase
MTGIDPIGVVRLGLMGYRQAHMLQRALVDHRIAGTLDRDLLLLLEHEPTVTLGRGTRATSLPQSPAQLTSQGLTVVEVERGGDVTWHGPGQLVGYPILDLHHHREDLHWYLRQVEEALIRGLARLSIAAQRNPGYTGVWTGGRKIASIGVHVRQWVTSHGFALNVTNDLAGFGLIVPCGIAGVEMTSVAREWSQPEPTVPGENDVQQLYQATLAATIDGVAEVFGRHPVRVTLAELLSGGTPVEPAAFEGP